MKIITSSMPELQGDSVAIEKYFTFIYSLKGFRDSRIVSRRYLSTVLLNVFKSCCPLLLSLVHP
jgi:hypothetical protein